MSTHPSSAVAAAPPASPVGSLPAGWQRPGSPSQSPTPAKNAERTRPSLYRISCVSQCRRASNLTSSPGLFQVSGSGSGRKRPRELRADCLKGEQSGRIGHHLLYVPKHFISYVYIIKRYKQMVPNGARWCPMVPNGARWCPIVPDGAQWCPMVPSSKNGDRRQLVLPAHCLT